MTDATKPLVLGYIGSHPFMTEAELTDTKQRLVGFARAEGYTLGVVYVEQTPGAAAFYKLMEEVERQEAAAVLVLSLPAAMRQQLEQQTRARVLIAHVPP